MTTNSIGCRIGIGLVVFALCLSVFGCGPSLADGQKMMGKTKSEALQQLGQPESEIGVDSTIIDKRKHSQAEIDHFHATTIARGLRYSKFNLFFNFNDVVIQIEPN